MAFLLHGAEIWNCTQAQIAKMNGLQYELFHAKLNFRQSNLSQTNFEWALPKDETKTPYQKSVETMIFQD